MSMRDIFVPMFQQAECGPQLDVAARLAPRLGAAVNAVFTRPDSVMAVAAIPDMLVAAGVVLQSIDKDGQAAQHSAHAQFDAWRAANGLTGSAGVDDVDIAATWHERVGPASNTVVEIGRVSDLIVVARPDPNEAITDEVFTAAIYGTGRPTLIAPDRLVDDPLGHVMIAWNGSLQASRAVAAAMPLLKLAQQVSVFGMPVREGELRRDLGLIEHLSRHDIDAECVGPSEDTGDVGAQLLDTAHREGATMIVMGAYTHSRVRESFLGGVTHYILKHAQICVVMAH
ncbi:MAG TPA: universal stress protein [Alphaproteobacteria bacterium]|nr:universal stress protein [Alphaproteobacteria bacterium]